MNFFKSILSMMTIGCMAGCGMFASNAPTIAFHADTNFTAPERVCLAESAKQWHDQTSGLVDITYTYDYDGKSSKSVIDNQHNARLTRWNSDMFLVKETEAYLEHSRGAEPDSIQLLGQMRTEDGIHNKYGQPLEVVLVMDRLQNPIDCKSIAIHEFGHALGLEHDDSAHVIMNTSYVPGTACLKKNDLLQFCINNKCADVPMHPCPDDEPLE